MSEHDFVAMCQSDSDFLLNTLAAMMKAKSDTALARSLKLGEPILLMIRNQTLEVNATVLNSILQAAGTSVQEILSFMQKHNTGSTAVAASPTETTPSASGTHL